MFIQALKLGSDSDELIGLPGNEPPETGSYVCVIPVKDYWRMRSAEPRRAGLWHYKQLDQCIIQHAREGRCVLVFDLSNEGPAYDVEIFDELLCWIEDEGLVDKHVIWLSQNRNIGSSCEEREPVRSRRIQFEHYDAFVKIMAWIFSPSSKREILGPSVDVVLSTMFDPSKKDSTLLCLNASPKAHRILTLAALMDRGLFEEALISFPGLSYPKGATSERAIFEFVDVRPQLGYLRPALAKIIDLKELKVDEFQETGNALFDKISVSPYERSFFSVVTETEMTNGSIRRVTEKSVKSFCLGHPTLIAGNPFSISLIEQWGFQDWNGLIDRSSEHEIDPWVRFELIVSEAARQVADIKKNPAAWLRVASEVGTENIRHAATGGFLKAYRKLHDVSVVERIERTLS